MFYNGEKNIPEMMEVQLSESFEERNETPAVECVARFININYGHNQHLLNSCKRLHDYSYFVACVRRYLRGGLLLKEALGCAVDECIEMNILKDILLKHRTEVEGMFLTTFNKKMYEEAMKMDGRREEQENTERERQRADMEKQRADMEKQRADMEKQRADEEKQRADEMELKYKELQEQFAHLKQNVGDNSIDD